MNAKHFFDKYWDGRMPVDIVALAKAAGVIVRPNPQLKASGQFFFDEEQPIIEYNPSEHNVRQRFTIAHELGHFVLEHGPAFRDSVENFNLSTWNPKEIAANRFAAEILMPEDAVEYLIHKEKEYSPNEMALAFEVSPVAMRYRLKNLGWLP